VYAHTKANTIPQTKSEARKLFEETTLYYGQPIGTRLNELFDQYIQETWTVGCGRRKRDILVVSDCMPSCESACGVPMLCRSRRAVSG
jgi:hypothetical protein